MYKSFTMVSYLNFRKEISSEVSDVPTNIRCLSLVRWRHFLASVGGFRNIVWRHQGPPCFSSMFVQDKPKEKKMWTVLKSLRFQIEMCAWMWVPIFVQGWWWWQLGRQRWLKMTAAVIPFGQGNADGSVLLRTVERSRKARKASQERSAVDE